MKRGRLIILLIDDNDDDILFFNLATERGGAGHSVNAVKNGAEAIRYLRGEGQYADRLRFPIPNVIMADLNMPLMNGFEFLRWVRNHPECSVIPTIVFSSSALEKDVREAYLLGANSFLSKPCDLNEMVALLRALYGFWSLCECPPLPSTC